MEREIWETKGKSLVVGKLPTGCQLCIDGKKMVLFITGLCTAKCFYCPLSEKRRWKDVIYANERKITKIEEAIEEAKIMKAEGTGITGGDPLIVLPRTIKAIKLLKNEFGEEHHIHLYTNAIHLTREKAIKMKKAGLDELRIHPIRTRDIYKVAIGKKAKLTTGIEIPAIPGREEEIKRMLKKLEKLKADFININELEFSSTNALNLKMRGLKLKDGSITAVEGSEEEAIRILEWAAKNTNLNVHYCPSRLKDQVQLKNRLKRRAHQIALKHEKITDEGLIIKGIIEVKEKINLNDVYNKILNKYKLSEEEIIINKSKRRIETSIETAVKIAKDKKLNKILNIFIVEEYPTDQRLEVTRTPLSK